MVADANPPAQPVAPPPAAATLAAAPQAVKRSMPLALSVCMGILLAALAGWFFYSLAWFVLLIYLSIVLATILEVPVKWLTRHGFSRSFAAILLMGGGVTIFAMTVYLLSGHLYAQAAGLSDRIQNAPKSLETWVHGLHNRFPGLQERFASFRVSDLLSTFIPSGAQIMNHAVSGFEIITFLIVIFFIVMYLLIDGPDHLKGLRRLIPRSQRLEITRLFDNLAAAHRGWALANIVNVTSAATMTSLGLWLLGVPGALILGFLAGLGELVPNVGPFLMAVLGVFVALVANPEITPFVIGMYVVVQTIQSYTITPLMMRASMQLPVLATIISVIVMGVLFGFLGVLVAIPLTADMVVLWAYMNTILEKDTTDNDLVNSSTMNMSDRPLPAGAGRPVA